MEQPTSSSVTFEPEDIITWQPNNPIMITTLLVVTDTNSSEVYREPEYVYEYDYYDSLRAIPLHELIPVGIIYGLTFLLGITGNSLVIFTICRHRRMRSPTNTFLVSLATADLVLVVVCIPIKLVKWFTFTWGLGEVLCKLVHYVQNVSVLCSVLTLTALSLERYYAIIFPMRAKYTCTTRRARRVVMVLWVTAIILATPIILGQVHKQVGGSRVGYWCLEEWPNSLFEQIYDIFMLAIILFIPLGLMTFAYINICKELWTTRTFDGTQSTNGLDSTGTHGPHNTCSYSRRRSNLLLNIRINSTCDTSIMRKQAVKMLVAVMALFLVCWAPLLIDNVLVAFKILDRLHYGPLKPIRQVFSLLAYSNSCVNPILYAFMSKSFRASFKVALCLCVERENTPPYPHRRECTPLPSQSSFSASRGGPDFFTRDTHLSRVRNSGHPTEFAKTLGSSVV